MTYLQLLKIESGLNVSWKWTSHNKNVCSSWWCYEWKLLKTYNILDVKWSDKRCEYSFISWFDIVSASIGRLMNGLIFATIHNNAMMPTYANVKHLNCHLILVSGLISNNGAHIKTTNCDYFNGGNAHSIKLYSKKRKLSSWNGSLFGTKWMLF